MSVAPSESEFLTVNEVARRLRRHPDSIRRLVRDKLLAAHRVKGGPMLIKEVDLEEFIRASRTIPSGEKASQGDEGED